jgi:hypothetical protein
MKIIPAIDRFNKFVKIAENGCWEWQGHLDIGGYGTFSFNNKPVKAHRFSFEYHNGPIPKGLELDHLCRNRACVNPYHLEPVTRQINESRAIQNPHNKLKTHCPLGHPYDLINTYFDKDGGRDCKICMKLRGKKYRAKPEIKIKARERMRARRARLKEISLLRN